MTNKQTTITATTVADELIDRVAYMIADDLPEYKNAERIVDLIQSPAREVLERVREIIEDEMAEDYPSFDSLLIKIYELGG